MTDKHLIVLVIIVIFFSGYLINSYAKLERTERDLDLLNCLIENYELKQ